MIIWTLQNRKNHEFKNSQLFSGKNVRGCTGSFTCVNPYTMKRKLVIAILVCVLLLLLFLLFLLFPRPTPMTATPQDPGFRLGEVTKMWFPKRVPVSDGFTFRYKLWDKFDTAIYYTTGADTFDVVTTFKKITGSKPPVILPDIISTVDDNVLTSAQVYSPSQSAGDNIFVTSGWNHFKNQTWTEPHNNKTFSFVDKVPDAYIELTCTCYKIEWWNEKRENHGIASVQKMKLVNDAWVSDGNPVDVDLYDKRTDNNSLLVWTSPAMNNVTNKFRFIYTGRKNSAATQTNVGHDKFIIYQKQ